MVNSLEFHVYFAQFCRDPTNGDHLMQITFWVHQKEKAKREILSKCTSETLHTDDRELPTDFFFGMLSADQGWDLAFVLLQLCSYLKIGCYRFLLLEPVCCKKQQKKFLTSCCFVEQGTSEDSEWYKIDPG